MKLFMFLILLLSTWVLSVFHHAVYPVPQVEKIVIDKDFLRKATWIDKTEAGIHQLIMTGKPYERGLLLGHYTKKLIDYQETELVNTLHKIIPSRVLLLGFQIAISRWFWGIEEYFESWMIEEMYGVSHFGSKRFDYLTDSFTRQVAYHGLHEIGQMMTDQKMEDMGCTVAALKNTDGWIIGRNFDFEGGRIFDREKIVKWVFPDEGIPFVSVTWAGMVGVVTGINRYGIYISLNAAGTKDFSRYGTPSTLIVLKALQFSKSIEEAIKIIKSEKMFISDIFVVADSESKSAYKIEKSPKETIVIPLNDSSIITNHFEAPHWKNDSINLYRKFELTSLIRQKRGEELIKIMSRPYKSESALEILRDKGTDEAGKPLHLGNRRAIDALIATHSVIYHASKQTLYVSKGPGISGEFIGYELKASFTKKYPVTLQKKLPRDPLVSDEVFHSMQAFWKSIPEIKNAFKADDCQKGLELLQKSPVKDHYEWYNLLGNYHRCKGNMSQSKIEKKKALSLLPAYNQEITSIKRDIL
jgi:predicted choloylglycine hydrolase